MAKRHIRRVDGRHRVERRSITDPGAFGRASPYRTVAYWRFLHELRRKSDGTRRDCALTIRLYDVQKVGGDQHFNGHTCGARADGG
jgi:hypothetical protein